MKNGFWLGGKPSLFWALLGFVAGLASFILDLLLAICLQRFFVATELISDLNQTRFFGPIRDSRTEAVLLLIVGVTRMFFYWCNFAANGISQVLYEKKARENIAVWAIRQGKSSSGSVSNLYNDILLGASQSIASLQFIFVRFCMLLASLLVLTYYSEILTLFIFIILLFLYPIQRKLDKYLTKNGKELQSTIEDSSNILFFGLQNSVYLKIHGLINFEILTLRKLVEKFKKHSVGYYYAAGLRGLLPQFVALVFVVFVASRTGTKFLDSPGQLVAYLYLSIRFFQTIGDLGRKSANLRSTWPRLTKFTEWSLINSNSIKESLFIANANFDQTKQESEIKIEKLSIECKNMSFNWPDSNARIINNLSIEFEMGTWTTFFGESGKGKSTLLKIISGLYAPTNGKLNLRVNGHVIQGFHYKEKLQKIISYVGTEPVIIPGTVRENLVHGLMYSIDDYELEKFLRDHSCDFIFDLPNHLNYNITENDTGLSTGQKQRISIARALLREPKILVLDEITSNLDEMTELDVLKSIKKRSNNLIVLAAGHRKSFKIYSDKTFKFTDDGNLIQF